MKRKTSPQMPMEPEVLAKKTPGTRKSKKASDKPSIPILQTTNELEETNLTHSDEDIETSEEDPSEDELVSSLPTPLSPAETEIEGSGPPPSDSLKRYLEDIRRYPLLEPDEEFALAMKLKENGDLTAARSLVSANLRLVVKIAFEYRTFYLNLLDLIQEGNIGLMKAVSKYDPSKGVRLGYYASWWIRSYILKYLLDNFRLVRIGTTQAQKKLFYHLMREKEKLEAQGLLAGPKLLAEKLNVREKDVIEMEQRLSGRGAEMSLDTPVNRNDEGKASSHLDLLEDHQEIADEALAQDQLLSLLKDSLPQFEKTLNDKELRILNDRLLSEEPKTLQEVADLYGLTRERARQIETKVIEKLRVFMKNIF